MGDIAALRSSPYTGQKALMGNRDGHVKHGLHIGAFEKNSYLGKGNVCAECFKMAGQCKQLKLTGGD